MHPDLLNHNVLRAQFMKGEIYNRSIILADEGKVVIHMDGTLRL